MIRGFSLTDNAQLTEFILNADNNDEAFFCEMNVRLQVEVN